MYNKIIPASIPSSVLGGEASSWDENCDAANVDERVFHRLPPVAERLWSAASVNSLFDARNRMAEFRCKQLRRGILAGPTYPDYCDVALTHEGGINRASLPSTVVVALACLGSVAAGLAVALGVTCWKLRKAQSLRGERLLQPTPRSTAGHASIGDGEPILAQGE